MGNSIDRDKSGRFKKGLIPWNKGIPHRPETIEKLKGQHTSPNTEYKKGHQPSEETKRKQKDSAKKRFVNPIERDKIRVKNLGRKNPEHSTRMKKYWYEDKFIEKQRLARKMKPNNAEKFLGELLNRIFTDEYKYVGDLSFVLGGKCPDFMNINGKKKLIELYGNYYHDPIYFPDHMSSEERIAHFKKYGFETLVIWERELKDEFRLIKKLQGFNGE